MDDRLIENGLRGAIPATVRAQLLPGAVETTFTLPRRDRPRCRPLVLSKLDLDLSHGDGALNLEKIRGRFMATAF